MRLNISWADLEPVKGHWNKPYLHAIDHAIAGFRHKGIAVILQMYQVGWSPAFLNLTPKHHPTVQPQGVGMPEWLYPASKFASNEVGTYYDLAAYNASRSAPPNVAENSF